MKPDDRIEYGGLYAGKIEVYTEFEENEEASKIVFWDRVEAIGYVNEINIIGERMKKIYIVNYCSQGCEPLKSITLSKKNSY